MDFETFSYSTNLILDEVPNDEVYQDLSYCDCRACGESGCCPAWYCWKFRCKYGDSYIEEHKEDAKLMNTWYVALKNLGILNPHELTLEEAENMPATLKHNEDRYIDFLNWEKGYEDPNFEVLEIWETALKKLGFSHPYALTRERVDNMMQYNDWDSEEGESEDPGYCITCKKPWELVRPGKSQPTCNCDNICRYCGKEKETFTDSNPNPNWPNHYGVYCRECGIIC